LNHKRFIRFNNFSDRLLGCYRGVCAATPPISGYLNNPEDTAYALRDEWMHTDDAGTIDEDGFLFVADRVKDMIVTGG
jgi:acyl-coenzyme A synthetase/AMP-(fatty) acid ligase